MGRMYEKSWVDETEKKRKMKKVHTMKKRMVGFFRHVENRRRIPGRVPHQG